jgi:DNA-binding protein HU-beta
VPTVNRSTLVAELARRAGLSAAASERVVAALFDAADGVIAEAIGRGEAVSLGGFGRFAARQRGVRTGRNPRTAQVIEIPAATQAVFRPGTALKDALSSEAGVRVVDTLDVGRVGTGFARGGVVGGVAARIERGGGVGGGPGRAGIGPAPSDAPAMDVHGSGQGGRD